MPPVMIQGRVYDTDKGVWVVYSHDMSIVVDSIYDQEINALRKVNKETYLTAAFVPFGMDLNEAVMKWERRGKYSNPSSIDREPIPLSSDPGPIV